MPVIDYRTWSMPSLRSQQYDLEVATLAGDTDAPAEWHKITREIERRLEAENPRKPHNPDTCYCEDCRPYDKSP